MGKLEAGSLDNFSTNTPAGEMDAAFVSLWGQYKEISLPNDAQTKEDRRLLFVAIARGTLKYLHDHRRDIETTEEQSNGGGTEHDHQLEFEWE